MANWKRLLLIGIVAYVLFFLAKIPADLVLPQINQRLPNGTVSLSEPQGSIWSGSIDLTVQPVGRTFRAPGVVRVQWSFRPFDLLYGQLALDYWVKSIGLDINGFVANGLSGSELSIERGTIGSEWVNPLLQTRAARIEKPIVLKGVYWEGDLGNKMTFVAQGNMNWEGGPVSVSKPIQTQLDLPIIIGHLSATERNTLLLDVQQQQGKQPLLSVEVLTTGGVKVRVLKRVQALAGMGQPRDPDAVMIEFEQSLL